MPVLLKSSVIDPADHETGDSESRYGFAGFTLDTRRGCLTRGGNDIPLRPRPFDVLRYLVEHPRRLVTKDELIAAVWAPSVVTDGALVQCIMSLRRSLGDQAHQLIRTVPKRGYLLESEVSTAEDGRCLVTSSESVMPVSADKPELRDRSLAIGQFSVEKGAGLEALAVGMLEGLRCELTGYTEINFLESSIGWKSGGTDDAGASRAKYVLRGDLRRQSGGLCLRLNLIRTRDAESVWAHARDLLDRNSVEPATLARIVGRLIRLQLVADQQCSTVRARASRSEAAEAVCAAIKENYLANQGVSPDANLLLAYGERAASLDPRLVESHWIVALAHYWQFIYQQVPWREAAQGAQKALDRAVAIDDRDPMVYWLRGMLESGIYLEYQAAVADFQKAIELDPLHPNARWFHAGLGEVALRRCHVDEALEHYRRSIRLYDADGRIWYQYAGVLYAACNFRGAVEAASAGLDLISSGMYRFLLLVFRMRAYLQLGELDMAQATSEELSASRQGWGTTPAVLAMLGRVDEARDLLKRLDVATNTHPDVIVHGYVALGDSDKAFEWLHRAIDIRAETTLKYLRTHPDFDYLRRDQRWTGVIQHLRTEEERGRKGADTIW